MRQRDFMMTDDRQPRTQWCGETMTAPITSREELLASKVLILDAETRRDVNGIIEHVVGRLVSSSDSAADIVGNAVDDIFKLGSVVAQGVANPVMWVCLVPNPLGELRIRAWTADRKRTESLRAEGLDMQALYTSPVPSTGLPAPAPHDEVREATYDMRALAKFLYEHCGLSPDKAGKTASEILSEYDVRLSEQECHAIGHARYQVDQSSPDSPNCCFDYELVATLLDVIDRFAAQPDRSGK